MSRLRVLVLGSDCNPEEVSIPFVTYSHAAALAKLHDVTLAARETVEGPLRRSSAPFKAIEIIRTPRLDRVSAWVFRKIFKSNYESLDLGILAGAGIEVTRFLVEGRINWGLKNVLKNTGDGCLATFHSAEAAVRSALRIQESIADAGQRLPPERVLHHRIGIHLGDVFLGEQVNWSLCVV